MKKLLITDVHTHTAYSPDGRATMAEMLREAHSRGVDYYGVADHFDFDMVVNNIPLQGDWQHTDEVGYFREGRKSQKDYAGKMNVLIGAEFGYTDNPEAHKMYVDAIEKYAPDFVVQSVHTLPVGDYAYGYGYVDSEGKVRDQREVYEEYLGLVRRSLDVQYPFDILAHVGYCTRYAPYEDRRMRWQDYAKQLDDILLTVIRKGKILEVNSSNKLGPSLTLPDNDLLERYYELGGRQVSFASDAHDSSRIAEHREKVMQTLRSIGFEYVTVPCHGEYIKVEI